MARSSTFHPIQFEMKSMEPKQLSETKLFLEQSFLHTHIRYPLNIEKSEEFLSNEKILLIGNEGRADPGFLCFLPRKPVQFLKCRLDSGFYVRLRVEQSLFQNGTIFIASVHLNTITVQDCWMWQGESLQQVPYSKRFSYAQKFLQSYIVQDPRLSGFEIQLATQHPLESFKELQASQDYASIDLIPENPKRRRFFYRVDNAKPVQKPIHKPIAKPAAPLNTPLNGPLVALAKNIQGLPDAFDLFSVEKKHIGEAAIQEEDVSAALRQLMQKTTSLLVIVEWNSFLDAYEIKQIAPQGSRIFPFSSFKQGAVTKPLVALESHSESASLAGSDE